VRASRRELLAAGGACAGALALGGSAAGAAAATPSDRDQLERLLELELRLEAAYAGAFQRGLIDPGLGELLLAHEREHVRALTQVLHVRRPSSPVAPEADGRRAFAQAALALEGETVAAYAETLTTHRNERLLQPLGSIMACGAQHEVALRNLLGDKLL
jgi:hypothetical protein